jgi:hypothetical protein
MTSAEVADLRRQIELQKAQLERLKTLGTLDGLLMALTDVLDVRQVFDRVSEIAQKVLPHNGVVIGQVIDEGARVRMYATQGLGSVTSIEVPNLSQHLLTMP